MAGIIDAHLHLDESIEGSASNAVRELERQLERAGVAKGIVLQLQAQRWSREEVADAIGRSACLEAFVNVSPFEAGAHARLEKAIETQGYIGLKLHPRLECYRPDDEQVVELVRKAGDLDVPVLIDAFPDGTALLQGFNPLSFARLVRSCPGARVIVAHMGGHHVIDFMMLGKRIPNMYFDISFSLLYYRGSSITADIVYACQSMKFERVFYGSDYPDRGVKETLDASVEVLTQAGISKANMDRLLYDNAQEFFGWGST